jgi:hypothetical protein
MAEDPESRAQTAPERAEANAPARQVPVEQLDEVVGGSNVSHTKQQPAIVEKSSEKADGD